MRNSLLIIVIFIAVGSFFTSCNMHEDEIKALQYSKDSLLQQLDTRDSTIDGFFESFNSIQDNLAAIKEKENIISMNSQTDIESSPDIKDQIQNDIQSIYDLLQENKDRIAKLQKQLKNSNINIKMLKETIDKLQQQIQAKDAEIADLKQKLEAMDIQINILETNVDSLSQENASKDETIAQNEETITQKEKELNTAYYVFGTQKELKENGIITKEGGFIGLGKIAKLRSDFNKDYFSEVDIRDSKEIPLACKKAEILTTHPNGSYELVSKDDKIEKIVIKDPKEFWKASKYLVIVIE